jgi:hypothetical protein
VGSELARSSGGARHGGEREARRTTLASRPTSAGAAREGTAKAASGGREAQVGFASTAVNGAYQNAGPPRHAGEQRDDTPRVPRQGRTRPRFSPTAKIFPSQQQHSPLSLQGMRDGLLICIAGSRIGAKRRRIVACTQKRSGGAHTRKRSELSSGGTVAERAPQRRRHINALCLARSRAARL